MLMRLAAASIAFSSLLLGACAGPASSEASRAPQAVVYFGDEERPVPQIKMGDPSTVERIIALGTNDNRVMDHLTHLATEIGPRLTGSSNAQAANEWTRDQFASWGLKNARIEKWGEVSLRFDRDPSYARILYKPTGRRPGPDADEEGYETLRECDFTWLAWSVGTDGASRGKVVRMPETEEAFDAARGDLAGAWILLDPEYSGRSGIRGVGASMRQRATQRHELRTGTGDENEVQAEAPAPAAAPGDPVAGVWTGKFIGPRSPDGIDFVTTIVRGSDGSLSGTGAIPQYRSGELKDISYDAGAKTLAFTWPGTSSDYRFSVKLSGESFTGTGVSGDAEYTLTGARGGAEADDDDAVDDGASILARVLEAGPAGFISSSKDERVWTTSANGWREMTMDELPQDPEVALAEDDFDFLSARLSEGVELRFEADLACTFTEGPIPVYNTIAMIPGTEKPDEYVIVSAHLDSWNGPGSQGTVDNGTGSSVTLEAARLLMAAGAKPKRSILFILWTGEEQGLLGSRAWVKANEAMLPNISAVFVDDGGSNYEGGLECIEPMAEYLAAASAPINNRFYSETDGEFMNVKIRVVDSMPRGGGSDHASFNQAGVPGFFWDEVGRADYRHGWHTQFDRIDQAIPEYLRQSATCAAVTAYNLACAPELLPRQPQEEEDDGGSRASR